MAFGMSLFAVALFASRRDNFLADMSLATVFLAQAFSYPSFILDEFNVLKVWSSLFASFDAVSLYILLPALWFYVKAITAGAPLLFSRQQLYHLIPFGLAFLLGLMLSTVPYDVRMRLLDGPIAKTFYEAIIAVLMNVVFLAQPIVTIAYVAVILRTLVKYRSRLKDLFASTEHRELNWIGWFVVLFSIDLFATFFSDIMTITLGSGFYGSPFDDAILLLLFGSLALWGARQKPGLLENALSTNENVVSMRTPQYASITSQPAMVKYGRSALTEDMRVELAGKIIEAMEKKHLYLDANLSLKKLATHLGVHGNYISQTLNTILQSTFFDYINRWRIKAAKPHVAAQEETILKIAYDAGFNSRSSFYKAFKKETGKTPTEYRYENRLFLGKT